MLQKRGHHQGSRGKVQVPGRTSLSLETSRGITPCDKMCALETVPEIVEAITGSALADRRCAFVNSAAEV